MMPPPHYFESIRPGAARRWIQPQADPDLAGPWWYCPRCGPLIRDADVLNMIEKFPGIVSVILSDMENDPVEWRGDRLRAMRDGGDIKSYPASYLLANTDSHRAAWLLQTPQKSNYTTADQV
jgi:hypothetical protein